MNLSLKRKKGMCNEKRKDVCLEGVTNATSSPQESSAAARGERSTLLEGRAIAAIRRNFSIKRWALKGRIIYFMNSLRGV